MSAPAPPRHTLVWPGPAGRSLLRCHTPAAVTDWVGNDLPLVVRRRAAGDPPDAWPLALALPPLPAGPRPRFALCLPAGMIARQAPPPTLVELLDGGAMPPAWLPRLRALLAVCDRHGVRPRVFGGAMWQHLSRRPFLRPGSDLDLLWLRSEFRTSRSIRSLLSELNLLADAAPRLDGELVFADGSGAHWRELAAAGPDAEILLKTAHAVRLVPVRTLLDPVPA